VLSAIAVAFAVSLTGVSARASEELDVETLRALTRPPSASIHTIASLAFGDGLRFNNPFRLRTELGSDEQSLSLTRGYVDLGVAVAAGRPDGIQHGAALRLSIALGGVPQQVLTPSYFLAYRGPHRAMAFGRLGPAIILSPDPNVGGELALGGAYFLTAGIGVSAEVIGDLFYGAATPERSYSVIPILSAQFGLVIDYEVLP
jgi:hypothetical protein